MALRQLLLLGLIIITSQGCVYRMDIPQGNRVDAEKLAQLKTGMTRTQVEFLLGRAAINDQYHAHQAHYVYYRYEGKTQQADLKTMVLTYDDQDVLVAIDGQL